MVFFVTLLVSNRQLILLTLFDTFGGDGNCHTCHFASHHDDARDLPMADGANIIVWVYRELDTQHDNCRADVSVY